MSAVPERYYSLEEYFALEEASEIRHEYFQGMIYDMTGATHSHNIIVANVIASLRPQLRGKSCTISPSDLRVKVVATGLYTYPDVSVNCGPVQYDGTRQDTVTNPTLIIEVLSPSTKDYDMGTKFENYRTIASLREYLLIAQDEIRVAHYVRQDNNRWLLTEYTSADQSISLDAIRCILPLEAIYEDVQFGA